MRRRLIGVLAGVAICALGAWWVHQRIGWTTLLQPWQAVAPALAVGATLTQLASYLGRAARIVELEPELGWSRLGTCLRLTLINNTLNLLLPMRSGEASFPLLLKRWFGIELARGSGQLIWLRLADLQVLATVALAALVLQLQGSLVGLGLVPLLLAAATAPLLLYSLREPLRRRLPAQPHARLRLVAQALDGMPGDRTCLLRVLAWTWLSWGIKLAGLAALLTSLAPLTPAQALLGAIGGDLSTVLPVHAPGGFGTYEAGVAAPLLPFGLDAVAVVKAAVNLHLFVFGIALACGALATMVGSSPLPSLPQAGGRE
jgi:uncharacterized membrane protein YbhN (UPF0104 family)